jgi:hypothetical protein
MSIAPYLRIQQNRNSGAWMRAAPYLGSQQNRKLYIPSPLKTEIKPILETLFFICCARTMDKVEITSLKYGLLWAAE